MINRVGARLSPCFTPAEYGIWFLHFPSLISILKSLYNFFNLSGSFRNVELFKEDERKLMID